MDHSELWAGFPLDPRLPAHAGLRASDLDRDRVQSVLVDGFAEGRLDREEHDDRSAALLASRTLGELPPLVDDLVAPTIPAVQRAAVQHATPSYRQDLQARAERHWLEERRGALFGFLGPTLICWVIWTAVGFGQFPWPLIVTVVTGLNLARTLASREEITARELRRLEKKQARSLERGEEPPRLEG